MGDRCRRSVLLLRLSCLALAALASVWVGSGWAAQAEPSASKHPPLSTQNIQTQPIQASADQLTYQNDTEVYEAVGSVVIVQGMMRLTADRVWISMLSGKLTAMGHAHLTDPTSELKAEQLDLDINTDAGLIVNGTLYMKDSNTLVNEPSLAR